MDKRYVLGSSKDFHNFVNGISKEDKIGIVTHTDLDGLASGIFLQKILESENLKIEFMEFLDYSSDALKKVIKRNYDKLFFTDWNADSFPKDLNKLRKEGDILIFDHHPLNENLEDKTGIIKTDSSYCSSHALFDLAKDYFETKTLEWLVCSAIIFDYTFINENVFNFLKTIYPKITKENIWNSEPGKIGSKISGALIYYSPDFRKVYDLVLKKDLKKLTKAKEIISKEVDNWINKFKNEAEYLPEKHLYFYYATPKYRITSTIASTVSNTNFPKDSIIFVSDDINKKDFVKLSARNQTGKIKLGEVLQKCIKGFENSNAGGHDKAAAGGFPKKYLSEFKKRLLEELK